jgi:hypothetical protein
VTITIEPNPVTRTSAPVEGCDSSTPNRWAWGQVLENKGSSSVSFNQRINFFNGSQVSAPTLSLTLSPGERYTHPTRWCSALSGNHTFRTDWVTTSGQRITGPTVELRE